MCVCERGHLLLLLVRARLSSRHSVDIEHVVCNLHPTLVQLVVRHVMTSQMTDCRTCTCMLVDMLEIAAKQVSMWHDCDISGSHTT